MSPEEMQAWEPNTAYQNRDTWPPKDHTLYGMFHDARLYGSWQQIRYERVLTEYVLPLRAAAPLILELLKIVTTILTEEKKATERSWPCPKCGIKRSMLPACAQDGCPTLRGDGQVLEWCKTHEP